jgi:protein involved in polysaccharide export with SLBB domain
MRTLLCLLSLLLLSLLPANADQVLRDGDIFRLAIGGAPREYTADFELEYTINDGMVTIPIIGRMRAAGLSPNSLAGAIEKRLKEEKIFANPTVILNPTPNARTLVIGGAVRNPGRQPWAIDMTLTQAIAAASGPSEWAEDKVKLIRGGKFEIFSRKAIKKQPDTDPKVFPGDFVEVQGEF